MFDQIGQRACTKCGEETMVIGIGLEYIGLCEDCLGRLIAALQKCKLEYAWND